jgi:diaminopimelate decarboxylase
MLNYRKETLFVENVSLSSLAEEYGTPLYVYSRSKLVENYRVFDKAFGQVSHIVCYALKANSNHTVLKTLAKEGSGVDITSGGELYRSLKAGFNPGKIVYAGIGKTAAEIEYALKNKILMFNAESVEELYALNGIAGRLGRKASLAFRVNPDVDANTHKHITTGKSGSKFGIPYKEALSVYKLAKSLKNIDVAGIHCHIGSQITDVKPFHLMALRMRQIYDNLLELGIKLRYIDLGGGLGIQYKNEKTHTPAELAGSVLPVFRGCDCTFIVEPGRYIVGNTGYLVAGVTYRKKADGKNFLIVDAGMNDLVRPTLYEAYHDIVVAKRPGRKKVLVDVVGPICETGDFLGKGRMLPWVEQGERLVVKCAGAYSMAMSSQYNSRVRAAEVMVGGRSAKLIREREKYEDLIIKEKISFKRTA